MTNAISPHSYEVSGTGKFIETESRIEVPGTEGRDIGRVTV